jgi:hypothetical protein
VRTNWQSLATTGEVPEENGSSRSNDDGLVAVSLQNGRITADLGNKTKKKKKKRKEKKNQQNVRATEQHM